MKFALGVLAVLVVAVGVGVATDHAMLARATVSGDYQAQVRLGAATAGLFAGGAAGTLVGLSLLLGLKKKDEPKA